jgi:hypothetical protein
MKEELFALVFDSINIEKLIIGSIHLGEKLAMQAAAKTATPIDDAIEAIAFPAINPALEALVKVKVAELKASLLSAPIAVV